MLTYNHSVLTNNGSWLTDGSVTPPGPTFDSVTIGSQVWMSKNMAIDDGQGGIYTQTVNYGQGNVVEYYYTWAAALRVAGSISGWHLPSMTEWETLATAVGGTDIAGTKLKSTYSWSYNGNGTDDFGFTVFPAGYWNSSSFKFLGSYAYLWTTNEYSSLYAYCYVFSSGSAIHTTYNRKNSYGYSIRLIKD